LSKIAGLFGQQEMISSFKVYNPVFSTARKAFKKELAILQH